MSQRVRNTYDETEFTTFVRIAFPLARRTRNRRYKIDGAIINDLVRAQVFRKRRVRAKMKSKIPKKRVKRKKE